MFGRSSASGLRSLVRRVPRGHGYGACGRQRRRRIPRRLGPHRCGANPNAGKKEGARATFAAGDAVDHKTFGRGTVVKVDGDTLHVKFAKTGQTKKLLKDYAPIVKIG